MRYNNVISLDGGAAVKAGYENFMAQERRLLELAQTRADMKASTAGSKNLDVPTMVVRFQLYYNLETEALVNIKSEEVKQQNELLKTYAEIQRRVSELAGQNRTVNYFYGGSNHAEFQKDNYNNNASNPEALFDKFGIASMFNSHNENYGLFARSANHGQVKQPLHPLETLRGITRPKLDIFYDGGSGRSEWGETLVHSASQWSAFGTRLGDAVTLINQESQIQMNDISALEKEKNRFYEAGSNALSRLNEAILGIGRNV